MLLVTDSRLKKVLTICRRIFMENESIWFDDRHGDCVRTCQTGWKRGYRDKGFTSKFVFRSQGSCIQRCQYVEFDSSSNLIGWLQ